MRAEAQGRSEYGLFTGDRTVHAYFNITDGFTARAVVVIGHVGPHAIRGWRAYTLDRFGPADMIAEHQTLSECMWRVVGRAETVIQFR